MQQQELPLQKLLKPPRRKLHELLLRKTLQQRKALERELTQLLERLMNGQLQRKRLMPMRKLAELLRLKKLPALLMYCVKIRH
jgi:hypothetical protein